MMGVTSMYYKVEEHNWSKTNNVLVIMVLIFFISSYSTYLFVSKLYVHFTALMVGKMEEV